MSSIAVGAIRTFRSRGCRESMQSREGLRSAVGCQQAQLDIEFDGFETGEQGALRAFVFRHGYFPSLEALSHLRCVEGGVADRLPFSVEVVVISNEHLRTRGRGLDRNHTNGPRRERLEPRIVRNEGPGLLDQFEGAGVVLLLE